MAHYTRQTREYPRSRERLNALSSFRTCISTLYGTIAGDPMEKTALEALDWALIVGDEVAPTHPQAAAALELTI